MNSTKNQEIIDGIIAGEEVILKSFYKKNLPFVRQHILRYHGKEEDVEDIFQDALVIIYQKLREGSLQINTTVSTYFYGVCKNLWRNQLQKKSQYTNNNSLLTNIVIIEDTIIDRMIHQEQQSVYQRHFSRLSDTSKKILQLFYEGRSMRDIASTMGYTERYTRKKKYKSKESLLKMIRKDSVYQEMMSCE